MHSCMDVPPTDVFLCQYVRVSIQAEVMAVLIRDLLNDKEVWKTVAHLILSLSEHRRHVAQISVLIISFSRVLSRLI